MGLGSGVGNASGLRTSNPQLVGLWFGPEGDRDSEESKIRWGVVRTGLSPVQCSDRGGQALRSSPPCTGDAAVTKRAWPCPHTVCMQGRALG